MHGLLFIDDEEGIRRSVSRALQRSRYEVFLARSGDEGIDWLKQHPDKVATVVSDYKMPGMSGMETLAAIGHMDPEITRVLLTGYATMEAAIAATNEGIDGFLTKPFDNLELRTKLHEIFLRKRLKQFVPEAVYEKIQKAPEALSPSFHEATILFCDIRGFTGMSEAAAPEKIAGFLNRHFFSPMGDIAFGHNGLVDKHMGDSIMVVFGALAQDVQDPFNAVRAALAMQERAVEIDRHLQQVNGFRLRLGIGISTGKVFSGILGSCRKKEFTAIGMPVNVASRLQKLADGGNVLVSEETFKKVRQASARMFSFERLPPTAIRGMAAPMAIYRAMPAS